MGNVFSNRYIHCADTEIIEYSRRGEFNFDDRIKLVDHLESSRPSRCLGELELSNT